MSNSQSHAFKHIDTVIFTSQERVNTIHRQRLKGLNVKNVKLFIQQRYANERGQLKERFTLLVEVKL